MYSEWIDACETVAKQQVDSELQLGASNRAAAEDQDFSNYATEPDAVAGYSGAAADDYDD